MAVDLSKLKKHKNYQEDWGKQIAPAVNTENRVVTQSDNATITQRVQARYENIMRQTVNSIPDVQNNVPKVNTSQAMNANTGRGMRSTAKTSSVNEGKLPTLNETTNKKVLPEKYEEDKKVVEENLNKKWYERILQKSKIYDDNLRRFEDGYQFGDVTKTGLEYVGDTVATGAGTVADLGLGVMKGVSGIGDGIGKAITGGVAQVADWTGHDEYAKKLRNRLAGRENGSFDKKYLPTEMIGSTQDKVDKASIAGEYADKASESVGYMAGLMAIEAVSPGSSTAVMFSNATGNTLAEAYAKDENVEDWQAWTKAIGSGAIETVIEKSSGLLGGQGAGEKMAGKITEQISSGAGKVLSKLVGTATDEALEEFKSYVANYGLDRFIDSVSKVTGSDVKFSEDWNWNEVGEAMGLAFVTATIMGGGSINSDIKSENSFARNELIDSSNLGENSKAQLKRLSEKNNWTVENLKNMLEQGGNLNNENNIPNNTTIPQNNELLQNNNETVQKQNKMPQNENMKQLEANLQNQVKIDSENFAKQVDNVQNIQENNDLTVLNQTPQVYRDLGINDLPMTITKNHTIWAIQERSKENSHLHGIDKEIIKQIPEALTRPLNVVQSGSRTDSIVAITELADSEGNLIVVPIRVNGKANVNEIEIDANVLTSIYGKDNNYDTWMKKNIENGRVLYDIDEGIIKKYRDNPPRLQLPNDITPEVTRSELQLPRTSNSVDTVDNVSTLNTIIPQNENKMQVQNKNIINSTENSNESSFSFRKETSTNPLTTKNIADMYREEINEGKTRKHYKTVFESKTVGETGKQASKELFAKDTYIPISNQKTITEVNDSINRIGEENSYISFRAKIVNNEKVTLQDIATGERLIQLYSQQGDYHKVQDLIQDVAILGTELGQQVQALSLIKKMSPEGQLQYLNKLVERTNIKEKADIKVTDEMAKKILESKNQEELENNLTEVAIQIGEQIPITRRNKIRSWRYLSMLGNPKTHIKNIGANVAMNMTQNIKNKIAGGMEDAVSVFNKNMERTKTLRQATDEQIDFARKDAEYMKDLIDSGGKYDIKNVIQNNKKQFDNKVLNTIAEFNSNALDVEDKVFLKLGYSQALANYMTANKLAPNDMTGKILEKARQYASFQAQEATFHQFSALANSLNAIENRGGIGGKFMEAVLPFKKTPINIVKAGVEYSPVGLAKSLSYDLFDLSNQTKEYKNMLEEGRITQEEYRSATSKLLTKQIDNMAKGLTGTAIATIGYFLAQSGILKAGNDGEEDEFEEKMGKQEYSIQIGDSTYTLDWISPSAIPLFVGATVQQLLNSEEENKDDIINSALTAGAKAFEPMTEMSMLQSLTSAISSYEQGSSSMIFDLGASAISSYAGQFVPTALGQVARTIDPYERDTTSTQKGMEKKVEQFVKQQMNKLPGLSQELPVKQDIWGEDKKREDNIGMRLLTNMFLPYNRKKVIEDVTNTELLSVFEDTGERGILPGMVSKDLTINKEKYRLTAEEYHEAKKQFGSESKKILDGLIKSNSYKELSSEQRAKAIQDVYSYTKEDMKKTYAEHKKIELKTSNVYNTVKRIETENGTVSSYFEFHSQIDGMEKDSEKIKCLRDITTDTKTKSIIYEEYLMDKADEGKQTKYEKIKEDFGSEAIIDQYLDYKVKENDKLIVLRARGEKKKTEELSDVERINLLKEAGYNKQQNEVLYTNMIASDKNKMVYEYLKKINKGICIDDYMTYLTSDISADKTDNGLKSGKTVTGSASKKKGEIINKTNLNELAKIYLYATSNAVSTKTRSGDYYKLANYVHSLPNKEQKEILSTISSAKETTDGSYYWK